MYMHWEPVPWPPRTDQGDGGLPLAHAFLVYSKETKRLAFRYALIAGYGQIAAGSMGGWWARRCVTVADTVNANPDWSTPGLYECYVEGYIE